ncbi:two-component system response regulator (plasmid) [Burkholderia sp. MSMB0856]|uniref:response regulator transcription factor n=1 Tax=Burkholderia sp. MSMB0856 TaxID=1637869 RepID=UPI00085603A8|nr:response regulator transcription factor [Burkholderia sp. MSMB0856]AOJ85290.1 two-component system response regulator [Burkholderia sp. MSMB0856]
MKILCLEDDPAHAELIRASVESEGHDVQLASAGRQAIRHLQTSHVDLAVIDWQVPDMSGLEVLGWLRAHIGPQLPVLFLTCRSGENVIAQALDAGADDYMIKPAKSLELAARIKALLRRAYPSESFNTTRIEIGAYVVDIRQRTITRGGQELTLTPREFDLASLLFRNADRAVPREHLVRLIWGREATSDSRSLDTHVHRLRRKLEIGPQYGVRLRAIYQLGYCLEVTRNDEAEAQPAPAIPGIS